MKKAIVILSMLCLIVACSKDALMPKAALWIGLQLPAHFGAPVQDSKETPITEAGFILGKMLFFDPRLSRNNTISCGSCHIPTSAFTQHGHTVSHGIDDKIGTRNALPIQNILWQKNYFWDGGVHNIELIALNALKNPVELDESLDNIITKLNKDTKYINQFKLAYGTTEITNLKMLTALKQYMVMLISSNSKFDNYLQGKIKLSSQEMDGLNTFNNKCATCHSGPLQSDNSFRNNGISNATGKDKGRQQISTLAADEYKFKVPSLRNISYTAPYMHDGSISTLQNIMEHYNTGVNKTNTLDTTLQRNGTIGIPLTSIEKENIISFLHTLSDTAFIKNPLFVQ